MVHASPPIPHRSADTTERRFKKTGKRNDIFLATKFGITMSPERFVNGEPEYVKACMEKSLSKLGGILLTGF